MVSPTTLCPKSASCPSLRFTDVPSSYVSLAAFYTYAAAKDVAVRGLPPACFIVAPRDVIVARVRDIDDKVIVVWLSFQEYVRLRGVLVR